MYSGRKLFGQFCPSCAVYKLLCFICFLIHFKMLLTIQFASYSNSMLLLIDVVFRRNTTVLVPNNLNLKH